MYTHSAAWLMPTSRGRNQLEQASGTMPRRANTKPIFAFSDASRMSIGSVIVTPTPTAGPLIAAMTGFFDSKMRKREHASAVADDRLRTRRVTAASVRERLAPTGEIGSRTEAPSASGDDHDAHVVVGIGPVERGDHLVHHPGRERVQLVRTIEGDRRDLILDLVRDLLELLGFCAHDPGR